MKTRKDDKNEQNGSALPSRVAQLYYKHGLFLTSYPTCATSCAILVMVFCCYPLMSLPLPGTIPTKVILPSINVPETSPTSDPSQHFLFGLDPFIYVQQIILRSVVLPWGKDLQLTDAFRGPLFEVFKLLEIISNHEPEDSSKATLSQLCLHVENVKRPAKQNIFPEYNCLVLSPGNLWQQDVHEFNKDDNLLGTVFSHHHLQKTKVSTSDMLFGIPISDTGMKRYPRVTRPRVIQYAITLILKEHNAVFLSSLRQKLESQYPLHQPTSDKGASTLYIYYPGEFRWNEFVPLCVAYALFFAYIYFSVRKMEVIKSRLLLATSSVFTTIGSLIMSLGLCFFFGLTFSMQSKGVYPFLVILVGLENCLVITKSCITTDHNLDVKIRVAQGLSKEGWSITKNLLIEITILTIGLGTLVPVIQEFCIFAIVGLLSDFFLQMLLFSTSLGFNIKRVAFSPEVRQLPQKQYGRRPLNSLIQPSDKTELLVPVEKVQKISKRLRVVNFWARTRFFQRGFMIWMILWIGNIIYHSGIIEQIFLMDHFNISNSTSYSNRPKNAAVLDSTEAPFLNVSEWLAAAPLETTQYNLTDQLGKLKHPLYEISGRLSSFHWAAILKQYNISLSGRYVTVLPAIKIAHVVVPKTAVRLRNPEERPPSTSKWSALAVALDPLDLHDAEHLFGEEPPGLRPLYPRTPMELFLTAILCGVSVIVLTYTMVVLYRCICSRNYAEWRASWDDKEPSPQIEKSSGVEGFPIQVRGHQHAIECIVTDGSMIASSCLQGQLKIWDASNGELVAEIDRASHFERNEVINSTSVSTDDVRVRKVENSPSPPPPHGTRNSLKLNFEFGAANDGRENSFKNTFEKYFKPFELTNSLGELSTTPGASSVPRLNSFNDSTDHLSEKWQQASPIWSLDFHDNLIVLGCADGRLEFWEGTTGNFKCLYESEPSYNSGVTHIQLSGDRVVAARLSGKIDFLRLETHTQGRQIDWNFTSAYRRTHLRTGSAGSLGGIFNQPKQRNSLHLPSPPNTHTTPTTPKSLQEELRCLLESQHQGHQQPVTCMHVAGSVVFTGSQDHLLKVYHLESNALLFTLHAHCGPITTLLVDQWQAGTGCSGSQDGLLCSWDLITGACIYNLKAHDDSIISLACAPSYIISLGLDERLRVWERFQGHLLNTISVRHAHSNLLMLTPWLLVTGRPGCLLVWDVRTVEPAHEVRLDASNSRLCPKIMLASQSSVICDYGSQLRIVRFPMIGDKCE